jgi:DNA repair protein RecO (recombination protein O)
MTRSRTFTALILRARPLGESNREVYFLTAEEGILRGTVFGGPKSRLRAHAAPYHQGTLWIYRDPAKDFFKITDFDVQFWRPGLRENYERSMAAAAVAETILASHGGGSEWAKALALASQTLDAMETSEEETTRRLTAQFLWNWADILGYKPDLSQCSSCGRIFAPEETLWYSRRETSAFCASCAGLSEENRDLVSPELAAEYLPIGPGSRRWLSAAGTLKPAALSRVGMDRVSGLEAKTLVTTVMSAAIGKRLASWG